MYQDMTYNYLLEDPFHYLILNIGYVTKGLYKQYPNLLMIGNLGVIDEKFFEVA